MTIYWIQGNMPAMRGLSDVEKAAAKKRALPKVNRHWQVWLPQFLAIAAIFAFVFVTPTFPNEKIFLFAGGCLLGAFIRLPFNSYLQFYIQQERDSENTSSVTNASSSVPTD